MSVIDILRTSSNTWASNYYDTVDALMATVTPLRNMVEVGVAYGYHSQHLLKKHPSVKYTGVDPYLAGYDPRDGFCAETTDLLHIADPQEALTKLGDAVTELIKNDFGNRGTIMRMTSVEAAAILREQIIVKRERAMLDFVFIDGDHRREAVLADLNAWWPLVRRGGMMCGDDFVWPSVRLAVREFIDIHKLPLSLKRSPKGYPIFYFIKE